jgi:hypothetical protein
MRFVPLRPPVLVADAERVALRFADDALELSFVDMNEQPVRLTFAEVAAFRWDPFGLGEAPRDDLAYEVLDSEWLRKLSTTDDATGRHRHFKLCFNASCALDVIATNVLRL